ncbi:hypothetical protein B0A55_02769 [Friedmanniomyces simplex]|uniref:TMEM205-like domain-containing protein n=1 Tax=Friedmanniomyces simplex TaxID=329884 RepID=A0A4U0XUC7_9PEZI|nr:hypothetical protein B0A55_02769 [Friedmanniomyces simplex]
MPSTTSLTSPTSYHLLTYGTLLGSNLFQTFLNGPISYTALPRAQFSTLQQAIFPPYFSLQTGNFWDALVPIAVILGTSLVNLVVLGPATTRVMRRRKHQETRDGKRYHDAGPQSAEMQRLNSSFTYLHSASSLSNLIGTGAIIFYGFVLAEKI